MLRIFLAICSPFLVGCIGLYAFTQSWTAALYLVGFSGFVYLGMRFWEKHQGEGKGDSKLTDARMALARDWWIEEVKKERGKDTGP